MPGEKRSLFLDILGGSKRQIKHCGDISRSFLRLKGLNVSRWACDSQSPNPTRCHFMWHLRIKVCREHPRRVSSGISHLGRKCQFYQNADCCLPPGKHRLDVMCAQDGSTKTA
ncbi:hypothetical protein CHARACLAT_014847 [Characodon lateralis]|uniref:Uncharacterized protein n=1 Tax=Characodon lateralis TaxID=208331 RepID=A0ABU7E9X3_9TELE|nr:hypothetical protein [Characodon lateralis]